MKLLYEFGIIIGITFLGEALYAVLPFPVPASIYGLLLMLLALCIRWIKPQQVKRVSSFLIEIMPPMFIPAAVGLVVVWGDLKAVLLPVSVITLLTTVIVMAVTGQTAQMVIRRMQGKKDGPGSHSADAGKDGQLSGECVEMLDNRASQIAEEKGCER